MSITTLDQITKNQLKRHNSVVDNQLKQCEIAGEWVTTLCRNAHNFAEKERRKCWPRGNVYERLYRRRMNPHINFKVSTTHSDRYKHMVNRMWD